MEAGKRNYRGYRGTLLQSLQWSHAAQMDTKTTVLMSQHPENVEEKCPDQTESLNHFDRLPDHVITRHLFDKMPETRNLCSLFMASKRFASLSPEMESVTLEIPSWIPICSCHQEITVALRLYSLFRGLVKLLWAPFRYYWRLLGYPFRGAHKYHCPDAVRTKPPAIKNFFKKFPRIKSLNIHLTFSGVISRNPNFEPLLRWKFDKKGFVFVSAKSMALSSDDDVTVENADQMPFNEFFGHLDLIYNHYADVLWRLILVNTIVDAFPHLKNVVLRDSLKQGLVVLDEDDISGIREVDKPLEGQIDYCVKLWHIPVVKLPLSGYVMKDAILCTSSEFGIGDDLRIENAFEEKLYSELAGIMVERESSREIMVSLLQVNPVVLRIG